MAKTTTPKKQGRIWRIFNYRNGRIWFEFKMNDGTRLSIEQSSQAPTTFRAIQRAFEKKCGIRILNPDYTRKSKFSAWQSDGQAAALRGTIG